MSMYSKGLDANTIANLTQLTVEEVNNIIAQFGS